MTPLQNNSSSSSVAPHDERPISCMLSTRGPRSLFFSKFQRFLERYRTRQKSTQEAPIFSTTPDVCPRVQGGSVRILNVNARSFNAHSGEIETLARAHDIHIVCIQQSWLDMSHPNPIWLSFQIASRRDRLDEPNRGGLLTLVRTDVKNFAQIDSSPAHERNLHVLHTDLCSIAIIKKMLQITTL